MFHKEYIQDIKGSNAFAVQQLSLQPGLGTTFPWLAQISDAYEEYRFDGIIFSFKSTYSEFQGGAATGSLGSVIMATNYNANKQPFTDKRAMENYAGATSQNPTVNQVHAVQCSGGETPLKTLWVRTGAPQEDDFDLRLYDLGIFNIATQGMPTTSVNQTIGELWVTYQVTFFKPRYRVAGGKTDHYTLFRDTGAPTLGNITGTVDASHPFGAIATQINANTPTITSLNPSNGIFGIGTWISQRTENAGYQYINFPRHTAGGWYKITIYGRTTGGTISTNTSELAAYSVLGGLLTDLDWLNQDWKIDTASAPTVGLVNPANQREWMWSQVVRLPSLIDESIYPAFGFAWANANAAITANVINYDIFVEEVNPLYYTKPY